MDEADCRVSFRIEEDEEDIVRTSAGETVFRPKMSAEEREAHIRGWKEAVKMLL